MIKNDDVLQNDDDFCRKGTTNHQPHGRHTPENDCPLSLAPASGAEIMFMSFFGLFVWSIKIVPVNHTTTSTCHHHQEEDKFDGCITQRTENAASLRTIAKTCPS